MKYLKYFESFYTPAIPVYKNNIGTDDINDAGHNTLPYNSFEIKDTQEAFNKGQEDYSNGIDSAENPYLGQQYSNTTLIKAWNEGWQTAYKNRQMKNEATIDFTGNIDYPPYLEYDEEDTLDTAYQKGFDAAENDCDREENPFISADEDEYQYLEGLRDAWEDGWQDFNRR